MLFSKLISYSCIWKANLAGVQSPSVPAAVNTPQQGWGVCWKMKASVNVYVLTSFSSVSFSQTQVRLHYLMQKCWRPLSHNNCVYSIIYKCVLHLNCPIRCRGTCERCLNLSDVGTTQQTIKCFVPTVSWGTLRPDHLWNSVCDCLLFAGFLLHERHIKVAPSVSEWLWHVFNPWA